MLKEPSLFDEKIKWEKKRVMEEAKDKGCICPVCDQFVKVYRRTITSAMANQLIHLFKITDLDDKWVHTRELVMGQSSIGDFSKLRFWGLIVEKPHDEGNKFKKTSGYWSITDAGKCFIAGIETVQSHVLVYNNKKLAFEGHEVNIIECLGDNFHYGNLMKGYCVT